MSIITYPFDAGTMLTRKKRIKKMLKEEISAFIPKRIAVLGGSTTNEVVDQLELFLLNSGIEPTFYQSEYGQYWQDAVLGNSELDDFSPDIVYIHTTWRNIQQYPLMSDDAATIERKLNEEYFRFQTMWDELSVKYHCVIIQNNFERPLYRLLGNSDISNYKGKSNYICRLNAKFYEYALSHKGFYINDIDYISADFGLKQWHDVSSWYSYKYAMNIRAIPFLSHSVASIIKAVYGKNKKVLALDLDNTLWGGVIGDDGVEKIAIGPEIPEGQAYTEFQQYIKELKSIGVILTVNSKNEIENALAGLNHPDSVLKPDDFVKIMANWDSKDKNLIDTAASLNLGADSFVFVDDNPAEREIVRCGVAGVETPEIGQVESYIEIIDRMGCFEVLDLSQEDLDKSAMYVANEKRNQALTQFTDYGQYLDSLEMKAQITPFEPMYIDRIAQLTNKSNQFNLTTLRCSVEDIINMSNDENYVTLAGRLQDKFGDNGLVAITVGRVIGETLDIVLWLMSCRVLKRGLENAMMNQLVDECKRRGISRIIGHYYPTAKNKMVKDFYADMQFVLSDSEEDGKTKWILTLDNYKEFDLHMDVNGGI